MTRWGLLNVLLAVAASQTASAPSSLPRPAPAAPTVPAFSLAPAQTSVPFAATPAPAPSISLTTPAPTPPAIAPSPTPPTPPAIAPSPTPPTPPAIAPSLTPPTPPAIAPSPTPPTPSAVSVTPKAASRPSQPAGLLLSSLGGNAATATSGRAVTVPPGKFTLRSDIFIDRSYVSLRGAGVNKTILYIPLGLEELYAAGRGNLQATSWAFAGGFLGIVGVNPPSSQQTAAAVAAIVAAARRGARRLQVGSASQLWVGRWYKLALRQNPSSTGAAIASTAGTAGAAQRGLAAVLGRLFGSNPALQAVANAAAMREWGFVPPGSLPTGGGGASAAASLSPLARAAARYAVAGAYSHWLEERASRGGVTAAMAMAGSLDAYLYGDNLVDSGTPSDMFPDVDRLRMPFRVVAKGDGWVEVDRPLPIDLRLGWKPAIYPWAPTVQHSGIEDLTIQFKWDTYDEHEDTKGYNAIAVYDAANLWVKNVHIIDSTNGVFASGTEFVTLQNISFQATKPRQGRGAAASPVDGHHALAFGHDCYNLMTGFCLPATRFYHDVSLDALTHLSVVRGGSGLDLNMDTHRAATHNNLFTNLDIGMGTRPWESGGAKWRGAHCGANTTWWGIYSSNASAPLPALPDCTHGPYLNWVGRFRSNVTAGLCAATRWTVQPAPAGTGQLAPADLFAAQRAKRGLRRP
ncbi:hypothetical protein ABPG75_000519 [Micractinium tetrahymenae]